MKNINSKATPEVVSAARDVLLNCDEPTVNFLQRKLYLSYSVALEIMNRLEGDVVSPPDQLGKRQVLRNTRENR